MTGVSIDSVDDHLLDARDEPGTAPGDRRFRPDVEGLRAVAIVLVVLYHASLNALSGGYVGVDVFFVISGFVITGVLLRERSSSNRTSFLSFYGRRSRRIIPAATLVIVVTVIATYGVLGALYGNPTAIDARWTAVFLANFHFTATGTNYLTAQEPPSPLLNFWSLAVEEQFYLVYPAFFAVLALLRTRMSLRVKLAVGLTARDRHLVGHLSGSNEHKPDGGLLLAVRESMGTRARCFDRRGHELPTPGAQGRRPNHDLGWLGSDRLLGRRLQRQYGISRNGGGRASSRGRFGDCRRRKRPTLGSGSSPWTEAVSMDGSAFLLAVLVALADPDHRGGSRWKGKPPVPPKCGVAVGGGRSVRRYVPARRESHSTCPGSSPRMGANRARWPADCFVTRGSHHRTRWPSRDFDCRQISRRCDPVIPLRGGPPGPGRSANSIPPNRPDTIAVLRQDRLGRSPVYAVLAIVGADQRSEHLCSWRSR